MKPNTSKTFPKVTFLNDCQKSTKHTYDNFKFLLAKLKDVDSRKEGHQLLQALLNEFESCDNKEYFLNLYHFSFHELTIPTEKGVEKKMHLLQFPSIFSPEEWSFTFYNALSQYSLEEFHNKKMAELGTGNGWLSIAIAQDYMPEVIYALDINPKTKVCGEINLFLNALDSEGELIKDKEGKSILDRVVFHTSDLLTYSLEQKHKLDCIIGCIPQVLSSNESLPKIDISENTEDKDLHSLSNYYTPEGYDEDKFGLGLVVKSLEQAKKCLVPHGKMVLNMGGRPGEDVLDETFNHRGFKNLKLQQTKIQQAQDTEIDTLIDIEQSSSLQFEFFVKGNEIAISALEAQQYLTDEQDVFHNLFVYELAFKKKMNIRRLSKKDEKQLTKLRIDAYKSCRWFNIKNWDALSWSKGDQNSFILGIEENGKLIASGCFCKVFEKGVMEEKLCIKVDNNVTFPSLEVSKLVVALEKRGHGLMNMLHYLVYKAAVDGKVDIDSMVDSINEGVGRTDLKKEIGFELTKAKVTDAYHEEYEDLTPAILTVVKKENFYRGISVSKKYSKHPIESFEIEDNLMKELAQYMNISSVELLLAQ